MTAKSQSKSTTTSPFGQAVTIKGKTLRAKTAKRDGQGNPQPAVTVKRVKAKPEVKKAKGMNFDDPLNENFLIENIRSDWEKIESRDSIPTYEGYTSPLFHRFLISATGFVTFGFTLKDVRKDIDLREFKQFPDPDMDEPKAPPAVWLEKVVEIGGKQVRLIVHG